MSYRYPLIPVALFLVMGIIVADAVVGVVGEYVWLSWVVIGLLSYFIFRRPSVQSAVILLTVFAIGGWLTTRQAVRTSYDFPDEPIEYEAVLLSQPVERGKVIRFDMLLTTQQSPFIVRATLLTDTVLQRYKHLSAGDGIRALSIIEPPKSYYPSAHFNYERWLKSQNIVGQTFIYFDNWQKAAVDYSHLSRTWRARLALIRLRQKLIQQFQIHLTDGQLALTAALVLGDRTLLSRDTRNKFSIAGASHVLALSGLHLGIIYFFLMLLFRRLRLRWLSSSIVLTSIWLFALLVGMSASVVRSAIMITIFELIQLTRHNSLSINSLSLAAIIILGSRPYALFDIGFQLSFTAVLAILIYGSWMEKWVRSRIGKRRVLHGVVSLCIVSIAAQIGTAPLVAYYFERLPLYFLLTNLIVIPLTYAVLLSSFILLLLKTSITISIAQFFTNLMLGAVSWLASLPFSSIEPIHISVLQLVAIYLLIAAVTYVSYRWYQYKRQEGKIF